MAQKLSMLPAWAPTSRPAPPQAPPIAPVASHLTEGDWEGGKSFTDEDWDAATPIKDDRGLLADFSLGAAKGTGRMVQDANKLLGSVGPRQTPGPALEAALKESGIDTATLPAQAEAGVQPSNLTQTIGSFVPDVAATLAMPELRAGRAVRGAANALERLAVPGVKKEGSELLLRSGTGYPSEANAARWVKATQPPTTGTWNTWRANPTVQNVADSMTAAARRPSAPIYQDVLAGGAGQFFGGKGGATAAVLAKLASRPGVQANVARGIYGAAPAVEPVAAGVAGGMARRQLPTEAEMRRAAILEQLLGGGRGQR